MGWGYQMGSTPRTTALHVRRVFSTPQGRQTPILTEQEVQGHPQMLWDGAISWVPLPEPRQKGFFPHHSPVIKHSQGCQQALEVPTALCLLRAQPELKQELVKIKGFYSYKVITVR